MCCDPTDLNIALYSRNGQDYFKLRKNMSTKITPRFFLIFRFVTDVEHEPLKLFRNGKVNERLLQPQIFIPDTVWQNQHSQFVNMQLSLSLIFLLKIVKILSRDLSESERNARALFVQRLLSKSRISEGRVKLVGGPHPYEGEPLLIEPDVP